MPMLTLYRSPETRINPYTGEKMPNEAKGFPQVEINQKIFKNWVKDFIPDYTTRIDTKYQFDNLVKSSEDADINKVLLFTRKEKMTPVFRAVSAILRD